MRNHTPESIVNKVANYHIEHRIKYPLLTAILLGLAPVVLIADILPMFIKIQNQIGMEFYNHHRLLTAGGIIAVPLLIYAGLVVSIQHHPINVEDNRISPKNETE